MANRKLYNNQIEINLILGDLCEAKHKLNSVWGKRVEGGQTLVEPPIESIELAISNIDKSLSKLSSVRCSLNEYLKARKKKDVDSIPYLSDCYLIQAILKKEAGIQRSLFECQYLWKQYSKTLCATWLSLDEYSPKDIVEAIKPFLTKGTK